MNEISTLITHVNGGDFTLGHGGELHQPLVVIDKVHHFTIF